MRTAIIGGSLGGLACAHEIQSIGAEFTVYERSVDRTQPRGAGIVMQQEVADLLARIDRSVPSVSVLLAERQQLQLDDEPQRYSAPQWMTAWDTLYQALREPLDNECVRMDSTLTGLTRTDDMVSATFGDGHSSTADVVIGADGIGSATRRLLTGRDDARYSGYVAFRGLEPEADLPEELVHLLAERFTMFAAPGLQMLCYLVPGANGDTSPGGRRVNWVWYVNTGETRMERLMTAAGGQRFDQFLPPGDLSDDSQTSLRELAERELPQPFVDLIAQSRVFLQPVFDLAPAGMVADHVALIGDAAGTVRPHTASGTSKALGDAAGLAAALSGWQGGPAFPLATLQGWERARVSHLHAVARSGIRLARQSGLGPDGPQYLDNGAPTVRRQRG